MIRVICPKCKKECLVFYPKQGYKVNFDLVTANEKIECPNCKRIISYSIQKNEVSRDRADGSSADS